MFRSLGLETERLVMARRSSFEDRGDHVVMRTPAEPEFWYGNQVIWKSTAARPEPLLAAFEAAFPDAAHCVLSFDVPGMDTPDWVGDLPDFEPDPADILSLDGPIAGPDLPPGFTFRRIETDGDWAQVVDCQTRTGVEDGFEPARHKVYVTEKYAAVRADCEGGAAHWFGLFAGERLAADMGIVTDGRLARFQSVETMPDYRRQGLCAALLRQVHGAVTAQHPGAHFVIVAETESDAGRIYRRAGFTLHERLTSLMKRGY